MTLPASRFDGPTPNGPAAIRNLLIVHTSGLAREIVLLFWEGLTRLASPWFEAGHLLQHRVFLPMAQLMQSLLHPRLGLGFVIPLRSTQLPQVLAPMIKV